VTVSRPLPLLVWPLGEPSTLAAAAARVDDWPRLIEARPSCVPLEAMAELERLRRLSAQRALRMTGPPVRPGDAAAARRRFPYVCHT
jgi:hypothetical protein